MKTSLIDEATQYFREWIERQEQIRNRYKVEVMVTLIPISSTVTDVAVSITTDFAIRSMQVLTAISDTSNVRTRIKNMLEDLSTEKSWEQFMTLSADDISKNRNISTISIKEFGLALDKAGYQNTFLAQSIRQKYVDRKHPALKDEIEMAEIVDLTDEDWRAMKKALYSQTIPENEKIQLRIISKLQKTNNAPINAARMFPSDLDHSFWRILGSMMNTRWKFRKLPYRIKFTDKPTEENKADIKMQIGCYKK